METVAESNASRVRSPFCFSPRDTAIQLGTRVPSV